MYLQTSDFGLQTAKDKGPEKGPCCSNFNPACRPVPIKSGGKQSGGEGL
jgi:hypothetical protein